MPLNCAQARYNSETVSSALSRQLFRRGAIRDLGVGVLASRTFGADLRSAYLHSWFSKRTGSFITNLPIILSMGRIAVDKTCGWRLRNCAISPFQFIRRTPPPITAICEIRPRKWFSNSMALLCPLPVSWSQF